MAATALEKLADRLFVRAATKAEKERAA
jgi:hypothetical protein